MPFLSTQLPWLAICYSRGTWLTTLWKRDAHVLEAARTCSAERIRARHAYVKAGSTSEGSCGGALRTASPERRLAGCCVRNSSWSRALVTPPPPRACSSRGSPDLHTTRYLQDLARKPRFVERRSRAHRVALRHARHVRCDASSPQVSTLRDLHHVLACGRNVGERHWHPAIASFSSVHNPPSVRLAGPTGQGQSHTWSPAHTSQQSHAGARTWYIVGVGLVALPDRGHVACALGVCHLGHAEHLVWARMGERHLVDL